MRDGLTGDQRFFLVLGAGLALANRDEQLRSQVLSNPHSPPKFRVNGVVRNVDAWYAAFDVQARRQAVSVRRTSACTSGELRAADRCGAAAAAARAAAHAAAVLQAPPGAGKSTVVPLALLDEPWVRGGNA